MARVQRQFDIVRGIGPRQRDLEKLDALQVADRVTKPGLSDLRYEPPGATATRNGRTTQPSLRMDLPQPAALSATFGLDLSDFDWPKHSFTTSLEIRVFQRLAGADQAATFTVRSLPAQLDMRLLGAFLQKLGATKTDWTQPVAPNGPPPSGSVSDATGDRTLDSLPAPASSGGR